MKLAKILNKTNYCVVGNAPTELNKGLGNKIDSFQYVVRFNDYVINGFEKDYGTKTDIWIRATNDKVINTLQLKNQEKFSLILLRAESQANFKSRNYYKENNINYNIIPIEYELELSNYIKGIPSTGLLFLYILYKNNILNPDNIFGFSFCAENRDKLIDGKSIYYYTNELSEGFLKSKHNWAIEQKFYRGMIKGKI